MTIAIYGIGNFGYAFLKHLDTYNDGRYRLIAYDYKPDRVDYLKLHRRHPVLFTDTTLSDQITFTSDLKTLLAEADIILLAVPSTETRDAVQQIKRYAQQPFSLINTAKSLDVATGRRLSEVIAEELKGVDYSYGLLAGGTIATDLFRSEPLGIDLASNDVDLLTRVAPIFASDNLHVNPTTDLIGVEYASAFKNVISILAGLVNGLGFSYGSETHAISRLAQQIGDLSIRQLGAQPETFSIGSQCWGNDMWMSCTGPTRNREFGILLGSGMSADEAIDYLAQKNKRVEGVNTLRTIQTIPGIRDIPTIRLLSDLILTDSTDLTPIKNSILKAL